jgi:hypothetical protein
MTVAPSDGEPFLLASAQPPVIRCRVLAHALLIAESLSILAILGA